MKNSYQKITMIQTISQNHIVYLLFIQVDKENVLLSLELYSQRLKNQQQS